MISGCAARKARVIWLRWVRARSQIKQEWTGHVPLQMLKHFNQLRAFDGAFEMAFVNLARQRQRRCRRHRPPITGHALKHGGVCLCSAQVSRDGFLKEGEPKFIEKHDGRAVSPRLFLSSANSGSATPALTLRLVRRRAAGVSCGLKPNAANNRLRYTSNGVNFNFSCSPNSGILDFNFQSCVVHYDQNRI